MSEAHRFIQEMQKRGISLEVSGNFVLASPPTKMQFEDIRKMQQLNKSGALADAILSLKNNSVD